MPELVLTLERHGHLPLTDEPRPQRPQGRASALVLDDTGWTKQGAQSVDVARQCPGSLGRIANCQIVRMAA